MDRNAFKKNIDDDQKIKYLFRPGYNSNKWLIEIWHEEDIYKEFMEAIIELSPNVMKVNEKDLKVFLETDILTLSIKTNIGKIEYVRDSVWENIFIHSDDNACLFKIDEILKNNYKFSKEEVDFKKYK